MTKFKFILIALFAMGVTFSSCSENSNNSEQKENMEKTGKEYTSAYVCPMHCEGSGSEEAGTCPKCGMDYVANEDHHDDGHEHDEHEGHNH